MRKLYYSQKYNPNTGAMRIIVKTEQEKQNEVLTQVKKLLKI